MDEGEAQRVTFGELLRRRRAAAGLTQEELAERACISSRSIRNMERGWPHRPRQDTLRLLSMALHLSAEEHAAFIAAARPPIPTPGAPVVVRVGADATHILPLPPTPLIGREQDIGVVCALLRWTEVRLITLCGPPGVGKTRLGLQVAVQMLEHFADGVVFVSLAPLRDPNLVALSLAQALGVRDTGFQTPTQSLKAYLSDKHLLLLLDNFEHVAPAAALIAELLATCSGLKILITSRAALHLHGELEVPLLPLVLPDLNVLRPVSVEAFTHLAQVASVALFVQRA